MNTPDPQRLGGLAWAERTGGQLSRAERRHLLAAIALGQWQNAVGRVKLALGRLPAAASRVDLDTFQVPDSAFAREAEQACAELPDVVAGARWSMSPGCGSSWPVAGEGLIDAIVGMWRAPVHVNAGA